MSALPQFSFPPHDALHCDCGGGGPSGQSWVLEYDNDWHAETGGLVDLKVAGPAYVDRFGVSWNLAAPGNMTAWTITPAVGVRGVMGIGVNVVSSMYSGGIAEMVAVGGGPALDVLDRLWIVTRISGLVLGNVNDRAMSSYYGQDVAPGAGLQFQRTQMVGQIIRVEQNDGGGVQFADVVQAAAAMYIGFELAAYTAAIRYGLGAAPAQPTDLPLLCGAGNEWWTMIKGFNVAGVPGRAPSAADMGWNMSWQQGVAPAPAMQMDWESIRVYRWR